jgi:hypothetical protein
MGFLGRSSFAYAMFGAPFFVRPRGMLLGTVIPEVDYQPLTSSPCLHSLTASGSIR